MKEEPRPQLENAIYFHDENGNYQETCDCGEVLQKDWNSCPKCGLLLLKDDNLYWWVGRTEKFLRDLPKELTYNPVQYNTEFLLKYVHHNSDAVYYALFEESKKSRIDVSMYALFYANCGNGNEPPFPEPKRSETSDKLRKFHTKPSVNPEYEQYKMQELRDLCKWRGIVTGGLKNDLIARLREDDLEYRHLTLPSGNSSHTSMSGFLTWLGFHAMEKF